MDETTTMESERPGAVLQGLIAGEIEALRRLGALLAAEPAPRPSALALQVARCNRQRLRTLSAIEPRTGHSLRQVTPAVIAFARDPQEKPL